LKGALEYVGRDSLSGIGFRGANCSCEDLRCTCCSGINITTFNIDHQACTNITFYPKDLAMNLKLIVNEKELLNTVSNSGEYDLVNVNFSQNLLLTSFQLIM